MHCDLTCQERTKALGYMSSSAYTALEEAGHTEKSPNDVNELEIHVIRCVGLKPRREGRNSPNTEFYQLELMRVW